MPARRPKTFVPGALTFVFRPFQQGLWTRGPDSIAQEGENQSGREQLSAVSCLSGRALGEEKREEEEEKGEKQGRNGGAAQLHTGAEKTGDLTGLTGHGQIAGQDGRSVQDLFQVIGHSEEDGGHCDKKGRRKEPPGEEQHQELHKEENTVGKEEGLCMSVHPGQCRRTALKGDELAEIENKQGCKADQGETQPWFTPPAPRWKAGKSNLFQGVRSFLVQSIYKLLL